MLRIYTRQITHSN